jgi:hypothetical protein
LYVDENEVNPFDAWHLRKQFELITIYFQSMGMYIQFNMCLWFQSI